MDVEGASAHWRGNLISGGLPSLVKPGDRGGSRNSFIHQSERGVGRIKVLNSTGMGKKKKNFGVHFFLW